MGLTLKIYNDYEISFESSSLSKAVRTVKNSVDLLLLYCPVNDIFRILLNFLQIKFIIGMIDGKVITKSRFEILN